MSKFKDIAVTSGDGGDNIPDITDAGIAESAHLVWTSITNTVNRSTTDRQYQRRNGQPGFFWNGSVNSVVNALWPALQGGYLADKDEAQGIRIALNRYLRQSRNLICQRNGGNGYQSVWWISEHWSPLTVTKVGDDHGTEKEEKEEMTIFQEPTFQEPAVETSTTTLAALTNAPEDLCCRDEDCTYSTQFPQIRASHEKRLHGFLYRDGVRITLDSSPITDEEIRTIIMMVAESFDSNDPQTYNFFFREARAIDARVSKSQIRRELEALAEDSGSPLAEAGSTEFFTRYALVDPNTEEPPLPASTNFSLVNAVRAIISTPVTTAPSQNPEGSHHLSKHIVALSSLMTDLQDLVDEEADLVALKAELGAVTEDRNRIAAELITVRAERDEAQGLLNMLRSQLLK